MVVENYVRASKRYAESVERCAETIDGVLMCVWSELDPTAQTAWLVAAQFADAPATIELADAAGLDGDARAVLESRDLLHSRHDNRWTMPRQIRLFGRRNVGTDAARKAAVQRFLEACVTEAKSRVFATEKSERLSLDCKGDVRDQLHFERALSASPTVWTAPGRTSVLRDLVVELYLATPMP